MSSIEECVSKGVSDEKRLINYSKKCYLKHGLLHPPELFELYIYDCIKGEAFKKCLIHTHGSNVPKKWSSVYKKNSVDLSENQEVVKPNAKNI